MTGPTDADEAINVLRAELAALRDDVARVHRKVLTIEQLAYLAELPAPAKVTEK